MAESQSLQDERAKLARLLSARKHHILEDITRIAFDKRIRVIRAKIRRMEKRKTS